MNTFTSNVAEEQLFIINDALVSALPSENGPANLET